jgi:tRNA nucleotidyltransferase (CCA-adding enzyme)
MSDYMFMLESHLTPDQGRAAVHVQAFAAEANVNLFLTGGAMRDMVGGFPIRDLDFTVEGSGVKLGKAIAAKTGAEILSIDENRKSIELKFPGGVTLGIGMARHEKYGKPGSRPSVQPATIHEDLHGRDFTVNAIALSLNKASRGLILDPNNGVGDIEHKELRTVSNYSLYDDPSRILRLIRFRVRLGYVIAERTQMQYQNVREAGLEAKIAPESLGQELRAIAGDPTAGEILEALEQEKLIQLFSPALEGARLNLPSFAKLHKARQMAPFGAEFPVDNMALFLYFVTEKLAPKERSGLVQNCALEKADISGWQKLEALSKKLEKELKGAKYQRPSRLYALLSKTPGEEVLFLLVKSGERIVVDRLKNYLQKYLPAAQEVNDKDLIAAGGQPGTPKGEKLKAELIAKRLDSRPKKPVPTPEEAAAALSAAPVVAGAPVKAAPRIG